MDSVFTRYNKSKYEMDGSYHKQIKTKINTLKKGKNTIFLFNACHLKKGQEG